MIEAIDHRYLVADDGTFRVADAATSPPPGAPDRGRLKKRLARTIRAVAELQRRMYAQNTHSVLLIFQAMDAAGKDGTIRAVTRGLNPAGCQVYSFKQPSSSELDHDFLWRSACRLPERGRIGIFNRSYYEEVLVVRVHPGILDNQRLPWRPEGEAIWEQRFESIRDHEKHLARNGTVIVKFWLNVSYAEQRRRFLSRIDQGRKNWKFSAGDVRERRHWTRYMSAYEQALNATSTRWAPWYAIPADDKRYMRYAVAGIVHDTMRAINPDYPTADPEAMAQLESARAELEGDTTPRES